MTSPVDTALAPKAVIAEALDLGLQVWRNTAVRDKFLAAFDALDALASVPARSPDALTEALQAAWDEYMVTGEWEILRDVVRDAALARSSGDGGEQG